MSRYAPESSALVAAAPSRMATPPTKTCPLCDLRYDAAAVFCQKDGARLDADASVDPFLGKIILGQFRIEEAVGAGGMGTVYRAHQTNLSRDVAVKILHPELTKNADAVRRFHREAKVATSLEHPNLVRVFLFGELPEKGGLYLVMEYLHGRSLMEVMRKNGPLPIERALHMSNQLCSAIGAAHAKGIVHRDVKPDNIIITTRHGDSDFVKVLDFGIARLLWDEQSQLTQSGTIFGTARYISPEGAAGEFTDARSDVYSIGVLLYQMLSGVTPFESSSPMSMLMKHINDPAPDLRTMGAGASVPQPVVDVIMRSLAKNPDARYSTAHELGDALANAAIEAGVVLPGRSSLLPGDSFANMSSAGMRVSRVEPTHRPPPREETMQIAGLAKRRWPMALGAFLIGAVVMVGGATAIRSMMAEEVVIDPMAERMARARVALAAGHFQAPDHENVADLTHEILAAAPAHEAALALRAEAAVLLGLRGHEEHEAGHDEEARLAYNTALIFAPGDRAATAALEAMDEHEHHDEAGVSLAPASATTGERVLFLGVIGHDQEVDGIPRFEVVRGDRVLRSIDASLASDQHHYVASYAFRARGDYSIRFVVPTHNGDVVYTAPLPIVRRGQRRPPIAQQEMRTQVRNPWGPPDPTPTPTPTPTMDDGIDWTVPSDMSGGAPPP